MSAYIGGALGGLLGLMISGWARSRQARRSDAALARDLQLLAALPENSPHRDAIQARVDRRVGAEVGRPDRRDVSRAIIEQLVTVVVLAAPITYIIVDMARTGDETSDYVIGWFIVGTLGAFAFTCLLSVLRLFAFSTQASASPDTDDVEDRPAR